MRKVIIEASYKDFVNVDFKRNQITNVGQGFSLAHYKANTIRFRQNVGQSRQRNGGSSTFRVARRLSEDSIAEKLPL